MLLAFFLAGGGLECRGFGNDVCSAVLLEISPLIIGVPVSRIDTSEGFIVNQRCAPALIFSSQLPQTISPALSPSMLGFLRRYCSFLSMPSKSGCKGVIEYPLLCRSSCSVRDHVFDIQKREGPSVFLCSGNAIVDLAFKYAVSRLTS